MLERDVSLDEVELVLELASVLGVVLLELGVVELGVVEVVVELVSELGAVDEVEVVVVDELGVVDMSVL